MSGLENIPFDDGDLEAARTYLTARGWIAHDEYWDDIVIFRRPEEENRPWDEVVLPKKADKTFERYLKETARRLAEWDNQTEKEALFRLLNPDVNRVRRRLVSPELEKRALEILSKLNYKQLEGFVAMFGDLLNDYNGNEDDAEGLEKNSR